jgi:hypothetical protein
MAKKRGFGSMDPAKHKAIASAGGKAAHAKGVAHRYTPAEARQAGHKGGVVAHAKGRAHRFSSEEARKAARRSAEVRKRSQIDDVGNQD